MLLILASQLLCVLLGVRIVWRISRPLPSMLTIGLGLPLPYSREAAVVLRYADVPPVGRRYVLTSARPFVDLCPLLLPAG